MRTGAKVAVGVAAIVGIGGGLWLLSQRAAAGPSCGSGTVPPQNGFCPSGYSLNAQGCCAPSTVTGCPSPAVGEVNGECPTGYTPDPQYPGCCLPPEPSKCASPCMTQGECPFGSVCVPTNAAGTYPWCCVGL